ncbi:MAG: hypothetical protein AAFN93_01375 [Bacteroidota bacterium]
MILSLMCHGQSLLPNKGSDPIWVVKFSSSEPVFEKYFNYTYGDSITICDTSWLEIKEREIATTCSSTTKGYIREVGQQVWMKLDSICGTPAYLIYDFSLEVTDTFRVPSFYYSNTPSFHDLIVFARDTVEDDKIRLLFYEPGSGSAELRWQTGFGSVGDIFRFFPRCIFGTSCEISADVRCFQLDYVPVSIPMFFFSNDCEEGINRWYVNDSIMGSTEEGYSWETAFTSLQSALSLAKCGDEVWVADGVYFPSSTGNRNHTFLIPSGVKVYGGFQGNELSLEERILDNYHTILSGNIGDNTLNEDNSFHVVTFNEASALTRLDGFIIEDGYAFGESPSTPRMGGGIFLQTTSEEGICKPFIASCLFRNNTALSGGGMAILANSNSQIVAPKITGCTFQQNSAVAFGGGLFLNSFARNEDNILLLEQSSFDSNVALEGGGVYVQDFAGEVNLQEVNFVSDTATLTGGAINLNHAAGTFPKFVIQDCFFDSCHAQSSASIAVVNLASGTVPLEQGFDLEITDSEFIRGSAIEEGGAIILENSGGLLRMTMKNTLFEKNTVSELDLGAALYLESNSGGNMTVEIDRCSFIENEHNFPDSGDGVLTITGYLTGATISSKITNSIFSGNTSGLRLSAGSGGGFGRHIVANSVFYNNGDNPVRVSYNENLGQMDNAAQFYNTIFWEPEASQIIRSGDGSSYNGVTVDYSLLSSLDCSLPGGDEACGGNNIIGISPLFINANENNFQTAGCSPVRNSGSSSAVDTLQMLTDFFGNNRILENEIDIGIHEELVTIPTVETNIINASGPFEPDGEITITALNNLTLPINFLIWSTSDTTTFLSNVSPGEYHLQLIDAVGCEVDTSFIVSFVNSVNDITDQETNWKYWPNPTHSYGEKNIQLTGGKSGVYFIELVNMNGESISKEQFRVNFPEEIIQIEIPSLSSGIYQITIENIDTAYRRTGLWYFE